MSNERSKKYSDRCLKDMADIALHQIQNGEGDGMALVMALSQSMQMHPNLVVVKIQELSNMNV